jgi:hypothetical protein
MRSHIFQPQITPDAAAEMPGRPEDTIVVIRLQGWEVSNLPLFITTAANQLVNFIDQEAEHYPDRLTSWSNCVMRNVYQYLKSAHNIDRNIKNVFVAVEGTKETKKALEEILGKVSKKIRVWRLTDMPRPRGYRLACQLAFRQGMPLLFEREPVADIN